MIGLTRGRWLGVVLLSLATMGAVPTRQASLVGAGEATTELSAAAHTRPAVGTERLYGKEQEGRDLAVGALQYAQKKDGGQSGAAPSAAGDAGLREQVKAKRDELNGLMKKNQSAMEKARSLYKEADAAYKAGQVDKASGLLDQAIQALKP